LRNFIIFIYIFISIVKLYKVRIIPMKKLIHKVIILLLGIWFGLCTACIAMYGPAPTPDAGDSGDSGDAGDSTISETEETLYQE
jgi:hypothetical protein